MLPTVLSLLLVGMQTAPPAERTPDPIERSVVDFTLGNGWRFLLVPRAGAPVVAIETAIDVGSVDDEDGKRGLADLFAHLTMQGSERLGSTDWSEERVALSIVEESFARLQVALEENPEGATEAEEAFREAREDARAFVSTENFRSTLENAGGAGSITVETTPDWTRYAISLPSNQLETWCWLESERFTRPCLRNFFNERERCLDERRRDREASARTTLLEQLRLAAFTTHPYRHPPKGYVDDLEKLSRSDSEDFFRRHYGAKRLVTTLVGDLDPDRLRPLIERYFSRVPADVDSSEAPDSRPDEPQPTLERRIAVPYAAPSLMALAWTVPAHDHIDAAAIEVAARILGPEPGSRLHQRLVRREALATDLSVQTGWPGARSANLVLVELTPLVGVDAGQIESAIQEELATLRERGPTEWELTNARRSLADERRRILEDPARLARLLNHHQLLNGDWHTAFEDVERWRAVTPGAVQAVVDVYFADVRRTTAVLAPRSQAAAPPPEPDGEDDVEESAEEPR